MKIKLYGVRGSIASPSVDTVRYGGNTACVYVGDGETNLVFDAGTGIRMLGEEIRRDSQPIYLFFSHYHWDHIQGFPFFSPVYQKGRQIFLLADHLSEGPRSILEQMADPHFPVPGDHLLANVDVHPIQKGKVELGKFTVSTIAANHPGGCCAYRVDSGEGSFAYVTDNELFPPGEKKVATSYEQWLTFLQGVDLLLHDAMYLDHELSRIHGWGHSLVSQVLQLSVDARAKNLILFHHDPSRTDDHLDSIGYQSAEWMASQLDFKSRVFMAREGDSYTLRQGRVLLDNG